MPRSEGRPTAPPHPCAVACIRTGRKDDGICRAGECPRIERLGEMQP